MKNILIFVLALGLSALPISAHAQIANDDCVSATPISVTTEDGTARITVNTAFATRSSGGGPNCNPTGGDDDVWYTFVADGDQQQLVVDDFVGAAGADRLGYEVFASCTAPTDVTCGFLSFTSGSAERAFPGNRSLVPGETYYLRLFAVSRDNSASFDFAIQTFTPFNDECSDATPVPVTPEGSSGRIAATTATATSSAPVSQCNQSDSDDDVWFSFVATDTRQRLVYDNLVSTSSSSVTSMGIEVFTACGVAANLYCRQFVRAEEGSGEAIFPYRDDLVVGSTYYLRVYTTGSNGERADFDLAIQSFTPPPNNRCSTATPLTLGGGQDPIVFIPVNTEEASPTPVGAGCSGGTDDLYYSFTAPGPKILFTYDELVFTSVDRSSNGFFSLSYEILSSCSGGSDSVIECGELVNVARERRVRIPQAGNLLPGDTYYLRLYTPGSTSYATFKFAAGIPAANDACESSSVLPTSAGDDCVYTTVNTTYASRGDNPLSNCGSPNNNDIDVWYTFTATNTAHRLNFQMQLSPPIAHPLPPTRTN